MRQAVLGAFLTFFLACPCLASHARCSDGPNVLELSSPLYPEVARKARMQGRVLLVVVVDSAGTPSSVTLKRSLNPLLDAQAVSAVRKWRFEATEQETSRELTVLVNFHLADEPAVTFFNPCEVTVEGVAPVVTSTVTSTAPKKKPTRTPSQPQPRP